jgi:hypothetical protein
MKENDGGVISRMIYLVQCKNFCKCHSVPPPSTTIKNKKQKDSIFFCFIKRRLDCSSLTINIAESFMWRFICQSRTVV